jgi:hypothetical protein
LNPLSPTFIPSPPNQSEVEHLFYEPICCTNKRRTMRVQPAVTAPTALPVTSKMPVLTATSLSETQRGEGHGLTSIILGSITRGFTTFVKQGEKPTTRQSVEEPPATRRASESTGRRLSGALMSLTQTLGGVVEPVELAHSTEDYLVSECTY